MLREGALAPDIEARDQRGETFRLSDLRGRWVVLYFYPKDETIGCTREACAFRDRLDAFEGLEAEVVGVSVQDVESHRRFAERHVLPFRLVADPGKGISRAYDALGLLGLSRRVTYLIDPEGNVRDAYRSEMNPTSHVEHARERLRELRAATRSQL